MAAMTINGQGPIARFVSESGHRYTLRADGKILRQFRYEDGGLSNATICGKYKPEAWAKLDYKGRADSFRRYALSRGSDTVTLL